MPGFENIKKTVNPSIYSLLRAIDGARTRDPDLGKVVLHQLSHSRIMFYPLFIESPDAIYNNTDSDYLQALFI